MIEFWTDGSCSKNPGPGGWGVAAIENGQIQMILQNHQDEDTTNNREEMKAIITALELIKLNEYPKAVIYSDSAYCVNMANDWIYSWAKNDWMNSKKKTVENLDLVKKMYSLLTSINSDFTIEKVKGHDNLAANELVDGLATNNIKKINKYLAAFT